MNTFRKFFAVLELELKQGGPIVLYTSQIIRVDLVEPLSSVLRYGSVEKADVSRSLGGDNLHVHLVFEHLKSQLLGGFFGILVRKKHMHALNIFEVAKLVKLLGAITQDTCSATFGFDNICEPFQGTLSQGKN